MLELNLLLKNERLIGARSSSCNIVGAIIGGAAAIGAGIIGANASKHNNAANAAMTREQMAWQARQNEIDRVWNRENAEMAWQEQHLLQDQQLGHEQWMWERNNEYNDPSAQRARFEAAGINPYIAMQGQSGGVAATSADVPSVPSVPQASGMPGRGAPSAIPMQVVNPVNGVLQAAESIGGALDKLASAKQKGVETTQLENTMDDMMRKIKADADSSEYMAIINQANSGVAKEKARNEMDELTEKINLLRQQVFNAGEEGNLITQKALRETEERYLAIAKRNLTIGEYKLVKKNLDAFDDRLKVELDEGRSRIRNNNASANEHNAGAALKVAQRKTEDLLRNDKAAILRFEKDLKGIPFNTELPLNDKGEFDPKGNHKVTLAVYSAVNQAVSLGYITEQQAADAFVAGPAAVMKVLSPIANAVTAGVAAAK